MSATTSVRRSWLRAAVLVLLLAAGGAVAVAVELPSGAAVRAWTGGAGALGGAGTALAVGLVLLAPVPRSAVSALVGLAAGFWPGLAIAYAGGLLAGLAAFALSRALGRDAVQHLAGPRLVRMDDSVSRRGFSSVLTGRLVPVLPFVAVSYGAGLTGVRFRPYAFATALGLVPSTVVQVGVGASARYAIDRAAPELLAVIAVVVVLVGLAAAALWRRRRAAVPA